MNSTYRRLLLLASVMVAMLIALAPMTATQRVGAATITVMNTNDGGAGSLRQAIIDAMAGDTIDFSVTGTITLTSGELLINNNLTIVGPGAASLTVSGNNASRVFEIASGATGTISGLTISDGKIANISGGGIFNSGMLTLTNVVLSGNTVTVLGQGGGIFNNTGSTLTIANCTLSGNSSELFEGGGIYNKGVLTISNSTLSSNKAKDDDGGGIFNDFIGALTIANSTLSGNGASSDGGGIANFGTASISFTTLSGNSAGSGGGIFNTQGAIVNIKNSIVANSSNGGDCFNFGTWNAPGKSFTTTPSSPCVACDCPGFTHVSSAQLSLGPLANNGGPTQTQALLAGSVAIDAVTDCTDVSGSPVTTDQRGATRPVDGDGNGSALCDAGSFESQCITCPSNITKSNDPDQCGAVVNYPNPTADEGCSPFGCSPESGSFYPVGTTTVTCSSKQDMPFFCSFAITVNDTQAPTITCPPDKQLQCGDSANPSNTGSATATDNCNSTVTISFTDTATAPNCTGHAGIDRTWKATDSSGNMSTCVQHITFVDTTPPVTTCPPDKQLQCGASTNPSNTGTATATDNCAQPVTISFTDAATPANCTGKAGIDRTWKAIDGCGNMSTCVQHITFVDTTPPVLTCPGTVNATAAASCAIATSGPVSFTVTATDNCGGAASVACNPPSGSTFPVGTTAVNCTATDGCGNQSSCSFPVTVFSFCLQDETNPGNFVLINAMTGGYIFFCNGVQIASGKGTLTTKGCIGSIEHIKGDRRVFMEWDTGAQGGKGAGTAVVQVPVNNTRCQITDKNMSNNTCTAPASPSAPEVGKPDKHQRRTAN